MDVIIWLVLQIGSLNYSLIILHTFRNSAEDLFMCQLHGTEAAN